MLPAVSTGRPSRTREHEQGLKRSLGLRDLLAYGLVYIAPIAPVPLFGVLFNASHGMAPLVYVLGLVAMTFTALSYMAMAHEFPMAGSVYVYASRSLGPTVGFFGGWAILLDYLLFPAISYVACAIAVNSALPVIPRPLCILVLVTVVTIINYRGIETTARVSFLLLVFQIVLVTLFVFFCARALIHHVGGAHVSMQPFYNPVEITPALMFGALSIAVFSYLGFDAISTLSEESRQGSRAISVATLLSLLVGAVLFVTQAWLASLFFLGKTHLSPESVANASFYDLAGRIGGYWFKFLLAVPGIVLSGIAGAVAAQTATARVLYGMARNNELPRFLAHLSPKRQVPERAVFLVGLITLVVALVLVDRLELLTSMISFGALCAFLLVHASVIVHFSRRGRGNANWWRHRAVPAVGLVIIGYVLWNVQTNSKIIGVAWTLAGAVVLVSMKRHRRLSTAGNEPGECTVIGNAD